MDEGGRTLPRVGGVGQKATSNRPERMLRAPPAGEPLLARRGAWIYRASMVAAPALALLVVAAPPLPLDGVPVRLHCQAGPDVTRALAEVDTQPRWSIGRLCERVGLWLEEAGAHPAWPGIEVPAALRIDVAVESAEIEDERVIEQRIGGAVVPVAWPYWSVALGVRIRATAESGEALHEVFRRGVAEQEGERRTDASSLVERALLAALWGVPAALADHGAIREGWRPSRSAEHHWGPLEPWSERLGPLLAKDAPTRHDAIAIVLSSDVVPLETRRALATSALWGDPAPEVRRDVLAWWLSHGPAPLEVADADERSLTVLGAVLAHDHAPVVRAAAARALREWPGDVALPLLRYALFDPEPAVAQIAGGAFQGTRPTRPAPDAAPAPLRVEPWTVILGSRAAVAEGDLRALALALPGPVADRWLKRDVERGDLWMPSVSLLAGHPTASVRQAVYERLGPSMDSATASVIAGRLSVEPSADLRIQLVRRLATRSDSAPVLCVAADDSDSAVRLAVTRALGRTMDDPSALATLGKLREDGDPAVRRAARRATRGR